MRVIVFYTLLINLVGSIGLASKERGGGVAFVCKERNILGSKKQVYLADSYYIKESEIYKTIKKLNFSDSEKVVFQTLDIIKKSNSQVAETLRLSLSQLIYTFEKELPFLNTDKINKIPKNCKKEQLAIQDFETGIVRINQNLYNRLSELDKLLFKLHEGYLRVLWLANRDPNIKDVRDQVFRWVKTPEFIDFLQAEAGINFYCRNENKCETSNCVSESTPISINGKSYSLPLSFSETFQSGEVFSVNFDDAIVLEITDRDGAIRLGSKDFRSTFISCDNYGVCDVDFWIGTNKIKGNSSIDRSGEFVRVFQTYGPSYHSSSNLDKIKLVGKGSKKRMFIYVMTGVNKMVLCQLNTKEIK